MKRTKLANRPLPAYTRGEEIMNMATHIIGALFAIFVLLFSILKSIGSPSHTLSGIIYGCTMILVYTMSSIYHGMRPGNAKKVLQVLDHCFIYSLIAGTYTPILLAGFVPVYPKIGWGLLCAEWLLCVIATTLTAIDLKKHSAFSMICYVGMGWGIIFFIPQCIKVMTSSGFYLLLTGGIVYTAGAILYGIGSKVRWIHSIFHVFVVLGSFFQFLSIILYIF